MKVIVQKRYIKLIDFNVYDKRPIEGEDDNEQKRPNLYL